ncbi:zinc ribbon domain-containing protein, partial [Streptomyces anthocyanicus]
MSQMPQQAAVPKCPSCEEPLESGDRFCGACGYDLSVVPADRRPRGRAAGAERAGRQGPGRGRLPPGLGP